MTKSRLPYTRLDRFISRKKEELARLLAIDTEAPCRKLNQRTSKAAHLCKVITKAKAELAHVEARLTEMGGIQTLKAKLPDIDTLHPKEKCSHSKTESV